MDYMVPRPSKETIMIASVSQRPREYWFTIIRAKRAVFWKKRVNATSILKW